MKPMTDNEGWVSVQAIYLHKPLTLMTFAQARPSACPVFSRRPPLLSSYVFLLIA
jgi:hypothetical protein